MRLRLGPINLSIGFNHIRFFYYTRFVSWLFSYYPFLFLLLYVHFMYFTAVRSYIEKRIKNHFQRVWKK